MSIDGISILLRTCVKTYRGLLVRPRARAGESATRQIAVFIHVLKGANMKRNAWLVRAVIVVQVTQGPEPK